MVVDFRDFSKKNNAEKIFQEQLDEEYTSQWNKTGTFGLSEMIYNQLLDRYSAELGEKTIEKPSGPIELSPEKNNKNTD